MHKPNCLNFFNHACSVIQTTDNTNYNFLFILPEKTTFFSHTVVKQLPTFLFSCYSIIAYIHDGSGWFFFTVRNVDQDVNIKSNHSKLSTKKWNYWFFSQCFDLCEAEKLYRRHKVTQKFKEFRFILKPLPGSKEYRTR